MYQLVKGDPRVHTHLIDTRRCFTECKASEITAAVDSYCVRTIQPYAWKEKNNVSFVIKDIKDLVFETGTIIYKH